MKEKIILILKGIIVGVGKIIPGVSGSMLAISLGIYDKCIYAIGNFTKNIKSNIYFLGYIGIGIILSIGILSNMVIFLINRYMFLTMCLFIGLIVGGIPKIYKESKVDVKKIDNVFFIIIPFIIILIMNFINPNHIENESYNFFTLLIIGFIESFAMIVPGISGTALLMMLGYYDLVILRFSQIFNIMKLFETIEFFIPFGLGMIIGAYLISKLINYCLHKYSIKTYCVIFGLILSSIYILIYDVTCLPINIYHYVLGLIFIFIGFIITFVLDKYLNK